MSGQQSCGFLQATLWFAPTGQHAWVAEHAFIVHDVQSAASQPMHGVDAQQMPLLGCLSGHVFGSPASLPASPAASAGGALSREASEPPSAEPYDTSGTEPHAAATSAIVTMQAKRRLETTRPIR